MIELDEELYYDSGILAQGCWDKFDQYDIQAIDKLIELVIRQCAGIAEENPDDPVNAILDYYELDMGLND
jgi:hypothetical protein